ncbi:hypothetical protein [Culicoidibacter larvae]|nr:hypothetical protein [Culicoidibacter larvae]
MITIKINNKPFNFKYKRALQDCKQLVMLICRPILYILTAAIAMALFA